MHDVDDDPPPPPPPPPSAYQDAPSYHTNSFIGPSPSYRRQLRPSEQILAQGTVRHRPAARFEKSTKLISISLAGQEPNVNIPTYGRGALVDGVVTLAPEALENVLKLDVQIEGEMKLVIAEGGATTHLLLSHSIPLFFSSSPTRCPAVHTFSYRLPPRFEDGDTRRPLPPTYEVNFTGVPGVRAVVRYSITIKLVRQKIWKRKENLVVPFVYFPRARPPQPIIGMSFLSSLKSNPEEWSLFSSDVLPRFPEAVDSVITSSFVLPSTNIFPMSRKIPFHLQLSLSPVKPPSPLPSLAPAPASLSVPHSSILASVPALASSSTASSPNIRASTNQNDKNHAITFTNSPPARAGLSSSSAPASSLVAPPAISAPALNGEVGGGSHPVTSSNTPPRSSSRPRYGLSFLKPSKAKKTPDAPANGVSPDARGRSSTDAKLKLPEISVSPSSPGPAPNLSLPASEPSTSPIVPTSPSSRTQQPPTPLSPPSTPQQKQKQKQKEKQPKTKSSKSAGKDRNGNGGTDVENGHSLLTPLLTNGATIRVTLQRQISVDVKSQKVLKTIVCGEGFIRRVDLGSASTGTGASAGAGASEGATDGDMSSRGKDSAGADGAPGDGMPDQNDDEEGNDNEAGGFGVIREEDTDSENTEEDHEAAQTRSPAQRPQPQQSTPRPNLNRSTASSGSSTGAGAGAGTSTPPRGRRRSRGASTDRHPNQPRDGPTTTTMTQDDWVGWEGEVIPSLKQISVGGFRAAGLAVRDFIILTLIPPDPETSPLRTHQHAVPVRIVTDAWEEEED